MSLENECQVEIERLLGWRIDDGVFPTVVQRTRAGDGHYPMACVNKQGIAETAKTNGPTCDNTCIQKI